VLEQSVPQNGRSDLQQIRQQGKAIAGLIRQLQRYRQTQRPEDRAVDLNRIIPDAVAGFPEVVRGRISMHLEPGLPPIMANAADVQRLLTFLLRNALAASPTDAAIRLRSRQVGSNALLAVEDCGPPLPPEELSACFDLYGSPREGSLSCVPRCHRKLGIPTHNAARIFSQLSSLCRRHCQTRFLRTLLGNVPLLCRHRGMRNGEQK
jgi:signal transduction histidine kinase